MTNILNLLSSNKDFPNYQAERRIDIFINYFISRILTKYLGVETEFICPEFPLKKAEGNQSTKLDYLCKTEKEIIFVELKTDAISFKESQAMIYLNCKWLQCVEDLKQIIESQKLNSYKIKYKKLQDNINPISLDEFPIRVIYLSPFPNENKTKKIKIETPISFQSLKFDMTIEEKIVWEHLSNLGLNVFEIKK